MAKLSALLDPLELENRPFLRLLLGCLLQTSSRGRNRAGLVGDNDMSGLRIGLVFQSAAHFDSLTVRENVGFLLYENSNMPEAKISKLVTETLAAVGLKIDVIAAWHYYV
ncbi:hypothetical protein MLD38_035832 [Melastoma candidum]|uniref:Uncharacterized protein n=1 Tax=Melastoma candidum TaxID=119954 RepID=A0ACB9LJ07_9MYRT|nr:hypothetical protein MLD38_035832 [Melastoma candidum]